MHKIKLVVAVGIWLAFENLAHGLGAAYHFNKEQSTSFLIVKAKFLYPSLDSMLNNTQNHIGSLSLTLILVSS